MSLDPQDPFGERREMLSLQRVQVLGAGVTLESNDAELMRLALAAYGGLPGSCADAGVPELRVDLVLIEHAPSWNAAVPPAPLLSSGNGLLCATIDAGNFAIVDPPGRRALVCISRAMLQYAQLARYELIELAILTLVARCRTLVPLHAACVGVGDAVCLILGASGAGKSSLCLLGLQNGMFVLSEDSVFIAPETNEVFGVPNFLHLHMDAIETLAGGSIRDQIADSPIIERRSGAKKYQLDLRGVHNEVPTLPLRLAAVVLAMPDESGPHPALQRRAAEALLASLREEQPYAAGLPEWDSFCRGVKTVPFYSLCRTKPPAAAADVLRALCV